MRSIYGNPSPYSTTFLLPAILLYDVSTTYTLVKWMSEHQCALSVSASALSTMYFFGVILERVVMIFWSEQVRCDDQHSTLRPYHSLASSMSSMLQLLPELYRWMVRDESSISKQALLNLRLKELAVESICNTRKDYVNDKTMRNDVM